jgi:hypothetical protein
VEGLADLFAVTKSLDLERSGPAADRDKLAQAVETILTTKGTPVSLFNAVGTFIEEGTSDTISELWKAPLIAHLIDRVNERESQGEEVSNEA